MNREQILAEIEDYIGGNVECVDSIDRMALTVFLRAKLNYVRTAALEEAKAAAVRQVLAGGRGIAVRIERAIDNLKERP